MRSLFFAVSLALLAVPAYAEVLTVPDAGTQQRSAFAATQLPSRGINMAEVQRRYGEPLSRSAAGGTAPKQPLINRWDCDGFSVFFEKDRVIDAVVPGAPPPVAHRDRLVP